jgi:hypothetical protein
MPQARVSSFKSLAHILDKMKLANSALVLWLSALLGGLAGGCSSEAHSAALVPTSTSHPPGPSSTIHLAQATCWDTVSCCVQRNPLNAVERCGADPAQVASILKTLGMLNEAAESGPKASAEADVDAVEQAEDWSSIKELPEWKQRCIKYYNACQNQGWTGSCYGCMRYCEGQQEWPFHTCKPRKE